MSRDTDLVPLREMTRVWFRISLQTFGGPAGQIAVMQHALVDEKRWIGQQRFLHALNYCMVLPGPEAQQLAIYTGWLTNGRRGGLIAGSLFVLPGFVALMVLSAIYVGYGETGVITALFAGLAPAVIAIVVQAVVRVGRRALRHRALVLTAVASFLALTFFAVPFPLVIAAAGLVGLLLRNRVPHATPHGGEGEHAPPLISDDVLHHELPSTRRSLVLVVVAVVLWLAPVGAFGLLVGSTDVFTDQGVFFSGAAMVTFGGAYAVLTYVAQEAVSTYGWLAPGEMVRGLALAESTPGPLIMVVQFVAFLGAYRDPGSLDPWLAAVLAASLVVWVTFVPCFALVFLGAPYVERLRGNQRLTAALDGVTAAVVGVIANLAVFFALHNLFDEVDRVDQGPLSFEVPVVDSLDPFAVALTGFALLLVFRVGWGPLRVLGACAGIGLAWAGLGAVL